MQLFFVNLIIFAAITYTVYFLIPSKFQWIVLLLSSLVFYALIDYRMLLYVALTVCSVFFCAKLICFLHETQAELFENRSSEWLKENRQKQKEKYDSQRKLILAVCLIFNFGLLAVLKYFSFLNWFINSLFSKIFNFSIPDIGLLLPLSFYIFQSAGYILDVYRRKYPAEQNIAKFALFITFFPQIMQGPIGRYDHLAPQLLASHKFESKQFSDGLKLMFWGFIKKLLIADILSPFAARILSDDSALGITITVGILMRILQLYANFSGGIDVSRGIARCMGIEIAENFRRPFFAVSLFDFWRRWNITLGAWMKDYLLYSITFSKGFFRLQKTLRKRFGNYAGKIIPSCMAMTFIFIVVGIWHGAALKWLAFGFYNGGLIGMIILLQPVAVKISVLISGHKKVEKLLYFINVFKTFILVFFGMTLTAQGGLLAGLTYIKRIIISLFSPSTWLLLPSYLSKYNFGKEQMIFLFPSLAVFLTISLLQENGYVIRNVFAKVPVFFRFSFYCFFICYILIFARLVNVGLYLYGQF